MRGYCFNHHDPSEDTERLEKDGAPMIAPGFNHHDPSEDTERALEPSGAIIGARFNHHDPSEDTERQTIKLQPPTREQVSTTTIRPRILKASQEELVKYR